MDAIDERHSSQRLFPDRGDECCELTIAVSAADYSASTIARAVEDADAHLLNLNVTADTPSTPGLIIVDLRINHRVASAVARSLERHGLTVTAIHNGTDYDSELTRQRIDHLLAQISV